MNSATLNHPAGVTQRLEEIETDLAEKQNEYELAALLWFRERRAQKKQRAEALLRADGTVAEREAAADLATAEVGKEEQAHYEALKVVVGVLSDRANIGMALLKSQGRA